MLLLVDIFKLSEALSSHIWLTLILRLRLCDLLVHLLANPLIRHVFEAAVRILLLLAPVDNVLSDLLLLLLVDMATPHPAGCLISCLSLLNGLSLLECLFLLESLLFFDLTLAFLLLALFFAAVVAGAAEGHAAHECWLLVLD